MARKPTGRPNGRPRAACDGTANDYRRHKRHGETPCGPSVIAWTTAQRRERKTATYKRYITRAKVKIEPGIHIGNIKGRPSDVDAWRN